MCGLKAPRIILKFDLWPNGASVSRTNKASLSYVHKI